MTRTDNIGLIKPDFDTSPWHDDMYENFDILDGLFKSLLGVTGIKGVWLNSTAVVAGDFYMDSSSNVLYECLVSHTTAALPTTFEEDRTANPTYWSALDIGTVVAAAADTEQYADDAQQWANRAEDDLIPDENGGDEVDDYSSKHWNAKADASATAAAGSASAASSSETAAASSASAADTSETNAASSETAAASSASAASTSETNAASSASAASTSETNAADSASAASDDADAASTSETNAGGSAATANDRAIAADSSATAAAGSASAASTSATNALDSETNAATSETNAEKWAEEDEDVEVETGKYSAKHHATKAASSDFGLRVLNSLGLIAEPLAITTSGTYTPTAGARYALIELLGAGAGAGGTAAAAGQSGAGAGGGPGAYASFVVDLSALTGSPTITVGALGTGGATGGNAGSDGGDTSYDDTGVGGSHNITAEGGKGGGHVSNIGAEQMARGGFGGDVVETSGTADVKISGPQAGHGIVLNGSGGTSDVVSGHGGHSQFGSGAPGKFGNNAGDDGQGYGSGGSGAAQSGTTNIAGGDGTQGLIRITEFF